MNQKYFTTGAKKDPKDNRDLRIKGILAPIEIPKQKFILEDVFEPKNQGCLGSCTGQAQAHHKERQEGKRMSARFIMALSKQLECNTCYGGYARNTFKVVNEYGVCSEELYPEINDITWEEYIDTRKIPATAIEDATQHKSKSYWRLDNNIDEIRNTLLTYKNSVNMSMAWYKEFNHPNIDGIIPEYYLGNYTGHEGDIIGFDDYKEMLIVKNSWGVNWGYKGLFMLPYKMFNKIAWDLWCSLDIPAQLPVDNYYGEKRTWDGYLREKAMGLNPWLLKQIKRLPTRREIIGLAYGYHNWTTVFKGKNGDSWLYKTKPQLIKEGYNYLT